MQKLIASLTDAEKERAAAGQDPLSPTQELLVQRAARFGLNLSTTATAAAAAPAQPAAPLVTFTVDEETLRRREERFKMAAPSP